ncbi:Selenocysteine lyase/Cysteine desulfurase [Fodinibius salinus]|uniref:Selenocysteine lyase/Cysteine desulfurase n=1 Tax=Fodinibius salinus TaxID=860790 RepID=A0A5D3YGQ9_9BACT|nr:aminotransferase class V-fold PLP-dependent enzyme [Fodinibius salinus]TYP92611.1 Selenocysteine lyase/Cysteine desulfurase [Fodinibius salinus]
MNSIDQLATKLAPHYSYFDVSNRLLFTGHSHQAWPNVALEGLTDSFMSAATEVDTKWESAAEQTEILRNYLRNYYDDPNGLYCLGQNTHQLLVSWLSSFDLNENPKVITTDGEFHSMFRQLHRLKEEGLQVASVDPYSDGMVNNIEQQIDDNVCAIMLSRVYFESGIVNQNISPIAELARKHNIPFLIDDYHGTNVVPLSIADQNLEDCYFLIGGYKYLQWGEGNCFLRFPKDCKLRPAITGWFAEFDALDEPRTNDLVSYDDGDQRFASGTYDPASQFRAAKVVQFFEDQGLTPDLLQQQYREQVKLLKNNFLEHDFDPEIITLRHNRPLQENGGFLALRSPFARTICSQLMEKGVFTDARGDILRMGPAPYITSKQITQSIKQLAEVVNSLNP